jgi:Fe-Mn family superoxide dismutase
MGKDQIPRSADIAGQREAGRLPHVLTPLPYDYAALEPHIDARTMMLHHDMHHAAYVANLNSAIEKFPALRQRSALWLLLHLNAVPEEIRIAVHNNAGGHVNHSLFWQAMSPDSGSMPKGALADALKRDFGSVAQFEAKFVESGTKLFGSGWVWLVRTRQDGGRLQVVTTSGHDNPLMQGQFPLLLNDVWEHAYYLKYENRRADYLKSWWSVVDWEEVTRRFERSDDFSESDLEAESASLQEAF